MISLVKNNYFNQLSSFRSLAAALAEPRVPADKLISIIYIGLARGMEGRRHRERRSGMEMER